MDSIRLLEKAVAQNERNRKRIKILENHSDYLHRQVGMLKDRLCKLEHVGDE
jgi:hypothetical protein